MPCGSGMTVAQLKVAVKKKQPNVAVSKLTKPALLAFYEGRKKSAPTIPKMTKAVKAKVTGYSKPKAKAPPIPAPLKAPALPPLSASMKASDAKKNRKPDALPAHLSMMIRKMATDSSAGSHAKVMEKFQAPDYIDDFKNTDKDTYFRKGKRMPHIGEENLDFIKATKLDPDAKTNAQYIKDVLPKLKTNPATKKQLANFITENGRIKEALKAENWVPHTSKDPGGKALKSLDKKLLSLLKAVKKIGNDWDVRQIHNFVYQSPEYQRLKKFKYQGSFHRGEDVHARGHTYMF